MKLSIGFFGSPDFSARFLEKLLNDKTIPVYVKFVVTQPDKPIGRKKVLTPSPVKNVACKHNLEVFEDLSNFKFQISNQKINLALLYAFGEIIPPALLKMPKYGFWNIHPSLLPKYRGASPMAYPLILGDTETGVSLIQMDEELDHGPIIAQKKCEILPTDRRSDLETKLTDLGFELFKKNVTKLIPTCLSAGKANFNHSQPIKTNSNQLKLSTQGDSPTYTRRLTKQDGFIPLSALKKALCNEPLIFDELPEIIKDYYQNNIENCKLKIENSPKIVYDCFRGFYPWPGLWTKVSINGAEKRLKLTDISLEILHDSRLPKPEPGDGGPTGFKLQINNVQLEGKKEVEFGQFKTIDNF